MNTQRYVLVFLICIIAAAMIPITVMADGQDELAGSAGLVSSGTTTMGALSINSTPSGATIVLDGATVGTTPMVIYSITAGSHSLVLKKSGYKDYTTNAQVGSGRMTVISATMELLPGSLSIRSNPSEAIVFLDGTTKGSTPINLGNISVGSHTILLRKLGYNDYSATVSVSSGKTTTVSANLISSSGSINVKSVPSGATIILDGVPKGTTPAILPTIPVGKHALVLKKSGYNDYSVQVTVSSGQTASVSAMLTIATGSLNIKSNPSGATIFLDGANKGITPATLPGVSSGKHLVVLKKSGYDDYPVNVTVSSGDTETISVTLTPSPGSLNITSTPSGANILLDGTNEGTTPATLTDVDAGNHNLMITKSGYDDYSTMVTVNSGKTTNVSIILDPNVGILNIKSTPAGATIILDGSDRGTTPATLSGVSTGNHALVLEKSGYDDYSTTVTVNSGKTTTISGTLVAATGSIMVKSTPSGATILLDGVNKGITPTTLKNVPAGGHTIVLKKSGYDDYTTTVTVNTGKIYEISATLVIAGGTLNVTSSPSGATVVLDGNPMGITPVDLPDISAGKHTLLLKKNGYNDYSTSVTVTAGKTTSVSAVLKLSTGALSIESMPSGATIQLDGSYRGITPVILAGLSPGGHDLVLKMKGYQDYKETVYTNNNQTTYVSIVLQTATG